MEIVTFASDVLELEVLPEAGARLHRMRAFGHDLLRTPADPRAHLEDPFWWGGYVMAPWTNRLEARPTEALGRTVDLAPTFRDGTAIHGQVYARPWARVADATFAVRGGGNGWPWPYEVRLDVRVEGPRARLGLRLTNLADGPMPGGLGLHPWFRQPLELAIHAAAVFPSNHPSPPLPSPVAGELDLRTLRPFPVGLDATWSDLAEPPVDVNWPELGVRATMSAEPPASPFVVAASLPDVDGVAIELQTHAPSGLRRLLVGEPGPLAVLAPGASLALVIHLQVARAQA
ncbi:MAG: hypothetical protein L0221_12465 [Chloroflexi bacterium]|nr:hypothetical protein [Chloroflexota bacterium]